MAGALFFATCASVFLVYLLNWQQGSILADPMTTVRAMLFSTTLMGILLAHELGHFATARLHRFRLTLPWFLPAPILVGTLGAIIRLEERPRHRTGLLEMGAAGPLAGLVVVVAVMSVRLVAGPPADLVDDGYHLSRPILWWILSIGLTGALPPDISTQDPLAFAAWIGCLLTAMNLIPFGQLDGGHVLGALVPRWARTVGWGVTAVLLAAGFLWPGWAVWAALLHLMGARHPVAPKDDGVAPLSPRAVLVAGLAALAFLLCFTVVPVRLS